MSSGLAVCRPAWCAMSARRNSSELVMSTKFPPSYFGAISLPIIAMLLIELAQLGHHKEQFRLACACVCTDTDARRQHLPSAPDPDRVEARHRMWTIRTAQTCCRFYHVGQARFVLAYKQSNRLQQ